METQNKVKGLLENAHEKLDAIKTHMPKIIHRGHCDRGHAVSVVHMLLRAFPTC